MSTAARDPFFEPLYAKYQQQQNEIIHPTSPFKSLQKVQRISILTGEQVKRSLQLLSVYFMAVLFAETRIKGEEGLLMMSALKSKI